jgi:uncharacterized metal-binding protein
MKAKETINQCYCDSDESIVLSCSGASNLGLLSDLAARKLRDDGVCKMNCLAVAAAGIESSITTFKKSNLLVIDGCSLDCGKIIMNQAGIENYQHLRLTDLGYIKGQTVINIDVISSVYSTAQNLLKPV